MDNYGGFNVNLDYEAASELVRTVLIDDLDNLKNSTIAEFSTDPDEDKKIIDKVSECLKVVIAYYSVGGSYEDVDLSKWGK